MMNTDPQPDPHPDPPPREVLNDGQRDYLVKLIRSFRRDGAHGPAWDVPGITAAIRKAEQDADTGVQLAAAALAAAADPDVKTPGWIGRPGRHWPTIGGRRNIPSRLANAVECPDHEGQRQPCRACAEAARPATGEDLDAIRAVLAARRTQHEVVAARAATAMEGAQHDDDDDA